MMSRSRSTCWRWHSKRVSGLIIKTAKHSLTAMPCCLTAAGNLSKFHWLFYRTRMQILLTDILRLCVAYCDISHRSEVTLENLSHLSFGEFEWKWWERCSCHTGCTLTPRLHNYDTGNIFIKDSLKGRLICEDTGFSFVFLFASDCCVTLIKWWVCVTVKYCRPSFGLVCLIRVDFNDLLSIQTNSKSWNTLTFKHVRMSCLQSLRWKPNTLTLSWVSVLMVSTFLSVIFACFDVYRWSCDRESDLLAQNTNSHTDGCLLFDTTGVH